MYLEQKNQPHFVYGLSVKELSKEDLGPTRNIARVYSCHIDTKKQDRAKFFRRELVVLENLLTGQKVVRVIMGANMAIQNISKDQIAIEYDAILRLGLSLKSDTTITLRRANFLEKIAYYTRDNFVAEPFQFTLGCIGLVLSVYALFAS